MFKQYKKLPYTFVYLVAFFLLADVRALFRPRASQIHIGVFVTGLEHHRNACRYLPERQVLVLVSADHLPWSCSGGHVDRKYVGFLVHPTLLEDKHEEHGK